MIWKASPPPVDRSAEIAVLIETLQKTNQRLEELTAGEVDTVADRDGQAFLLRHAQDQLRHSEAARQAAILNGLPAHIALLDSHGFIISVNEGWQRFAGFNATQATGSEIGLNYVDICERAQGENAAEAPQVAAGIRAVLSGTTKRFSIEYPSHSAAEECWYLLLVTPLAENHPSGAVVMHLNITEERRTKDQLRESERRFSELLRNVELISVMLDRDARITYCNEYLLRLTGWRYEEVIGRDWVELFIPPDIDDLEDHYAALLANVPSAWHHENAILTRSGERRLIRWNNSVLRSGTGAVIGTASIGEDITDRTEAEARVAHLNRVYAMLSGITTLTVRMHDRDQLVKEACRIAVDDGDFRMAFIGLVDHNTATVEPLACSGHEDKFLDYIATLSLGKGGRDEHHMIAQAMRNRSPVIANDIENAVQCAGGEEHLQQGYRSAAVLPLVVAEQVVGIFALYAAGAGAFVDAELQLLAELAGNIAFAFGHLERERELNYLAYYDPMCGLANRSLLEDRLRQALYLGERYELKVAVLFIDLDRFKLVNDSLGHSGGDEILKAAASRLQGCVRDIDTVARVGGDEFVVVLAGVDTEGPSGMDVAQRILAAFSAPIIFREHEVFVSCSIGMAVYPGHGDNEEALLKNADAAMYQAKQLGRNNCHVYTVDINSTGYERLTLETALRHAVSRDELRLHYQPLVDLASGSVTGVEALIRWQRSPTELVSPALFIPLAEETGLIHPISQWVLETACAQNKAWQDAGLPPVRVAVNLSAQQFRSGELSHQIDSVLAQTQLQAKYLEVELTESMLMQNVDASIGVMTQLRKAGVRISLDDFGTGYSSLSYLRRFPIDMLKIDQSFVREITSDPGSAAIAYAIIAMAHSLRLPVLAEGVETEGQLALLRAKDCNMMQGYLFSRPLPPDQLAQLLREGRSLPSSPSRAAGPALLLLDDEQNVLSALKRSLRGQGYKVFAANTAKEAFEVLARNVVQVIVSDQRMAEMNGTEFFGRVKDLYPQTMRIMLSGYTELKTVTDAINRGAVYKFITKPWEDDDLQAAINEAFQRFAEQQRSALPL
ncbi:MAG: EAL domain-containing protein [Betaproteobacteria bacterium]